MSAAATRGWSARQPKGVNARLSQTLAVWSHTIPRLRATGIDFQLRVTTNTRTGLPLEAFTFATWQRTSLLMLTHLRALT